MNPPTPKYKIGDSVWIVGGSPIGKPYTTKKMKVASVHQYMKAVYYYVVEDLSQCEDLSGAYESGIRMFEEDCMTEEKAKETAALSLVVAKASKAALEIETLQYKIKKLKDSLPENIEKQIEELEVQLKELKGE